MTSLLVVIGGGLIGCATALSLIRRFPDSRVVVVEKESRVGLHQSGRNSNVLHSGIYYRPGSFKAKLCRAGRDQLIRFCQEHEIFLDLCGKIIVSTNVTQNETLSMLEARGKANSVQCRWMSMAEAREREPFVQGEKALLVEDAGIVDFKSVCRALQCEVERSGGEVVLNSEVKHLQRWQSKWRVETEMRVWEADAVINCAGVYSDRLLQASGLERGIRIIPFRGEYFTLQSDAANYCRHLIYPVPDPALPFLGVHFTRTPSGEVEVGPNAVLAFGREGYSFESGNFRDVIDTLSYPGFWRMARAHWDSGIREMKQSLSRPLFLEAASSLIPELTISDLGALRSGIRAQAVAPNGTLVDDFVFRQEGTLLHVLNAPSPGATASLAIGDYIASQLK